MEVRNVGYFNKVFTCLLDDITSVDIISFFTQPVYTHRHSKTIWNDYWTNSPLPTISTVWFFEWRKYPYTWCNVSKNHHIITSQLCLLHVSEIKLSTDYLMRLLVISLVKFKFDLFVRYVTCAKTLSVCCQFRYVPPLIVQVRTNDEITSHVSQKFVW